MVKARPPTAPPPPQAATADPLARATALSAHDLALDLDWLARLIAWRFQRYFGAPLAPAEAGGGGHQSPVDGPADALADAPADAPAGPTPEPPPDLAASISPYATLLRHCQATPAERAALLLAAAPLLRPQMLDVFFTRNAAFDKPFAEFGGQRDAQQARFWPSGETLAFVLAGTDIEARLALQALFQPGHWLARQGLLRLQAPPADDGAGPPGAELDAALLQGLLRLSAAGLGRITSGQAPPPRLGSAFPARALHTDLGWSDLVLHPGTLAQVREIEAWLRHGDTLLHGWGMARKLRPGCRVLFHGPPGTGKTMTATLLGQASGRPVYQVDLSLVVSKYIGETEKNLSRIFDTAQQQGWLLFFDEADALFGRRSDTHDAHDRYANQEVSYLLQRIESFDGITILASNQKDNIDPAFARRFEALIYFPLPRAAERLKLWQQSFPAAARLDPALDLARIAERHALSGGAILNVVRQACLAALEAGTRQISEEMLLRGIRRELAKDGREA